LRSIRSSWFVALVVGLSAGALPAAGSADTGPVPVDPPACVSVLPALTTSCRQPSQPQGLRPLAYSGALANAATEHAKALATAGMFTHDWPTTGRLFSSWIRSFSPARGYRAWSADENLLWASPGFTSASAVRQWLDSPAHRRVLLTKSWRELGIGVVSAVAAPGTYGGRDVQIAAAEFGLRSH